MVKFRHGGTGQDGGFLGCLSVLHELSAKDVPEWSNLPDNLSKDVLDHHGLLIPWRNPS